MTVARNTSAIIPQRLGEVSEVKLILYHASVRRDALWMHPATQRCAVQLDRVESAKTSMSTDRARR